MSVLASCETEKPPAVFSGTVRLLAQAGRRKRTSRTARRWSISNDTARRSSGEAAKRAFPTASPSSLRFARRCFRGVFDPGGLLFQIGAQQPGCLVVDFRDHHACSVVLGMHDLDHAVENLARIELAPEIEDLPDVELPVRYHQKTAPAHVQNHAREPLVPGTQVAAVSNGDT